MDKKHFTVRSISHYYYENKIPTHDVCMIPGTISPTNQQCSECDHGSLVFKKCTEQPFFFKSPLSYNYFCFGVMYMYMYMQIQMYAQRSTLTFSMPSGAREPHGGLVPWLCSDFALLQKPYIQVYVFILICFITLLFSVLILFYLTFHLQVVFTTLLTFIPPCFCPEF